MAIFKLITSPARHRYFSAAYKVKWFSWSDDFLRLLPEVERAYSRYGKPTLRHIEKYNAYNYTFDVDTSRVDKNFLLLLKPYMLSLAHFRVGKGLNFFSGLINSRMTGDLYHFTIALLRNMLVQYHRDEMKALYAPLTLTKKEDGFPLHCDLYIPEILWNVFEEAAPGKYGTSLFLPVKTLFDDILPKVRGLPPSKAARIVHLITTHSRKDRYEELYSLLHDKDNRWTKDLKEKMMLRAYAIKFGKGQGYMIQDRCWMHGRTSAMGYINNKRLHRLIFSNA